MNPEISIIIPIYNAEKYLSQCIKSALAQTYINFELILADDGSCDKSSAICDYFASKDNRIKVIHKTNGGPSSARNAGIDHATGNWIAFIDADDWVNPEYINDLFKAVDGENMLIVQGINYLNKEKDKNTIVDFGNNIVSSNSYYTIFSIIKLYKYGYPVSKLYNRDVIINNNIRFDNDINLREDLIFMLQYLIKIKIIKFIPNSNYYYRRDTCGLTYKGSSFISENKFYNSLYSLIDRMDKLKNANYNFIELKQIAASALMGSIFINYHPGYIKNRKERLTILNNLKTEDLNLIKQHYNISRKYLYFLVYLIEKKRYKSFDYFLILIFKIRFLIKNTH